MSFMARVETARESRKKSSHQGGKRDFTGPKKKMGMICNKRSSIAGCVGLRQQNGEAIGRQASRRANLGMLFALITPS
jgi:hypothetical protein